MPRKTASYRVKPSPKRTSTVKEMRVVESGTIGSHHVVPNITGGWDIKREISGRAIKHFDNKRDAVKAARQICRNQNTNLIVHGKSEVIKENGEKKLPFRTPYDIIREHFANVPDHVWDQMPSDLADNHDNYLDGFKIKDQNEEK